MTAPRHFYPKLDLKRVCLGGTVVLVWPSAGGKTDYSLTRATWQERSRWPTLSLCSQPLPAASLQEGHEESAGVPGGPGGVTRSRRGATGHPLGWPSCPSQQRELLSHQAKETWGCRRGIVGSGRLQHNRLRWVVTTQLLGLLICKMGRRWRPLLEPGWCSTGKVDFLSGEPQKC